MQDTLAREVQESPDEGGIADAGNFLNGILWNITASAYKDSMVLSFASNMQLVLNVYHKKNTF